jgi:hypothetical protein
MSIGWSGVGVGSGVSVGTGVGVAVSTSVAVAVGESVADAVSVSVGAGEIAGGGVVRTALQDASKRTATIRRVDMTDDVRPDAFHDSPINSVSFLAEQVSITLLRIRPELRKRAIQRHCPSAAT